MATVTLQRQFAVIVVTGLTCLAIILCLPLWLVLEGNRVEINTVRKELIQEQWANVMEIASEHLNRSLSAEGNEVIRQRVTMADRTSPSAETILSFTQLRAAEIAASMRAWLVAPTPTHRMFLLASAQVRDKDSFDVIAVPLDRLHPILSKLFVTPWRIADLQGRPLLEAERVNWNDIPAEVLDGSSDTRVVKLGNDRYYPVSIPLYDISDRKIARLELLIPVESSVLRSQSWLMAALVLTLLILGGFFIRLRTAIHRTSVPLEHIAMSIRGLAKGDPYVAIPSGHGQTEVASIAEALAVFRDKTIAVDRLRFDAQLVQVRERELLEAQLKRLAGVLDADAQITLARDLRPDDDFAKPDPSAVDGHVEGPLARALRGMTDRILEQQTRLNALLAERTADLELVRQALAERMQLNRLREEIAIARDLQIAHLPDIEEAQALRPAIDLYATMRPAKEVGGDVYDFRRIDGDRLLLIVGDASGKGIPAAMYILMTRILLQTAATVLGSTDQALKIANDALSHDNDATAFTTAFVAILHLTSGELRYTNAGHNKPLIRRANGRIEVLDQAHGVLMGAVEGFEYESATVQIKPGDTLLLYTDGVTEAHAPDDSLYGDERLASTLQNSAGLDATRTVQAILDSVDAFAAGREQSDDITVTVLRRQA